MKKILVIFLTMFAMNSVYAGEAAFPYTVLKEGSVISLNQISGTWSSKNIKNAGEQFVKSGTEYSSRITDLNFSTDCDFEFVTRGLLLGYSSSELKFYEISVKDGEISKRLLLASEVAELFPNYRIIPISSFSNTTNSYKFRKKGNTVKIIILNDTERVFDGYDYSSNNVKFEKYKAKGFLNISSAGMVQFSSEINTEDSPWYILLIR